MSENHREPEGHPEPSFLSELGNHDHAADALREVAGLRREQPPAPSPALAAFMVHPDTADPSLNHEQRRTPLMKVIHLKAARIRRAAAAAGAAVALATVGAAAMAATSDPVNTSVVQADPSDTTSTTTEATETAEPTETETAEPTETETAEPTETETAEPTETEEVAVVAETAGRTCETGLVAAWAAPKPMAPRTAAAAPAPRTLRRRGSVRAMSVSLLLGDGFHGRHRRWTSGVTSIAVVDQVFTYRCVGLRTEAWRRPGPSNPRGGGNPVR